MDWNLTQGGVLGVDPTDKHVLVARLLIVADRSLEQIDADLAGFVALARTWRNEILSYIGEDHQADLPGAGFIRV